MSRTAFAPERIATVLVGASATIALVLGMLGLYGIMSEAARRRQREFALRIALGARGGHVVGQVISEGAAAGHRRHIDRDDRLGAGGAMGGAHHTHR